MFAPLVNWANLAISRLEADGEAWRGWWRRRDARPRRLRGLCGLLGLPSRREQALVLFPLEKAIASSVQPLKDDSLSPVEHASPSDFVTRPISCNIIQLVGLLRGPHISTSLGQPLVFSLPYSVYRIRAQLSAEEEDSVRSVGL